MINLYLQKSLDNHLPVLVVPAVPSEEVGLGYDKNWLICTFSASTWIGSIGLVYMVNLRYLQRKECSAGECTCYR